MRSHTELRHQPVDDEVAHGLAEQGFRYARVATSDDAALDAWMRAVARGFHGPAPEAAADDLDARRAYVRQQLATGVWAADAQHHAEPVATVSSWLGELTVPGPHPIDSWAISAVTVSPLVAGRGIARAMLEGELRTAAARGVPVASLTVSEATLYGRYGFGIAADASDLTIDASRVRWAGPAPRGRLEYLDAAQAAAALFNVHERSRREQPGELSTLEGFWPRVTGALKPNDAETRARRFVCCRGDDGIDGVVVYRLTENPADFTKHTVDVEVLPAASDAAACDLWHHVLTLPLVSTVKAPLRRVDEPVRWMLGDVRAMTTSVTDHHWLRILDVPAALTARDYSDAGRIVLDVADDLDFAAGTFLLESDAAGRATVTPIEGADAAPELPALAVDAAALASLWLGGVGAEALAQAGHVRERRRGDVLAAERLFRSARTPWLSTWY